MVKIGELVQAEQKLSQTVKFAPVHLRYKLEGAFVTAQLLGSAPLFLLMEPKNGEPVRLQYIDAAPFVAESTVRRRLDLTPVSVYRVEGLWKDQVRKMYAKVDNNKFRGAFVASGDRGTCVIVTSVDILCHAKGKADAEALQKQQAHTEALVEEKLRNEKRAAKALQKQQAAAAELERRRADEKTFLALPFGKPRGFTTKVPVTKACPEDLKRDRAYRLTDQLPGTPLIAYAVACMSDNNTTWEVFYVDSPEEAAALNQDGANEVEFYTA